MKFQLPETVARKRELNTSIRMIHLSILIPLFWRKKKKDNLGISVGLYVSSNQVQVLAFKLFYKIICFVDADFKKYWTEADRIFL